MGKKIKIPISKKKLVKKRRELKLRKKQRSIIRSINISKERIKSCAGVGRLVYDLLSDKISEK